MSTLKNESISSEGYLELTVITEDQMQEKVMLGLPVLDNERVPIRRALKWEYSYLKRLHQYNDKVTHYLHKRLFKIPKLLRIQLDNKGQRGIEIDSVNFIDLVTTLEILLKEAIADARIDANNDVFGCNAYCQRIGTGPRTRAIAGERHKKSVWISNLTK